VEREQNLPTLSVDHLYRVRTPQREWLVHFEVQTRYRSDLPKRLAWYAMSLGLGFQLPLEIVLVLLVERYAPAVVPDEHRIDLDDLQAQVRFKVIRLWEIDAGTVLEWQRPSLWPWVSLMRTSPETLERTARQIASLGDRKTAAEFVVLGGLRYDKNDLAEMLGRVSTMLTNEQLEESSYYQMILEKGMEKGIEKGIAKGMQSGRLEEARRVLRRLLALRFPGLETLPELDAITSPERIESLLEAIVTAGGAEAARAAIWQAISS